MFSYLASSNISALFSIDRISAHRALLLQLTGADTHSCPLSGRRGEGMLHIYIKILSSNKLVLAGHTVGWALEMEVGGGEAWL